MTGGVEKINVVACEFCGYSEKYSADDQVGVDSYHDVRARVCRHERRCPKNPLVKAMMAIRAELESIQIPPDQVELRIKIMMANRMTYDCILETEVEIERKQKEGGHEDG